MTSDLNSLDNSPVLNVLGTPLEPCCFAPLTGFYRDGSCHTGIEDTGKHLVCVYITEKFLEFSKAVGNDLSTPRPEYEFVGLTEGDWWCLCVLRWKEAFMHGVAPQVKLENTHKNALSYVSLDDLKTHAFQEKNH